MRPRFLPSMPALRVSADRTITFRPLRAVAPAEWIALMNHPRVRRHLPLAQGAFDESDWATFIATKEAMWKHHGYGPWAFFLEETFVGWGGLQPEAGEPDLALIIHPDHWGIGLPLATEIMTRAFRDFGFTSITALLPPSRIRTRGLLRLGFRPDGTVRIAGESFHRYRLDSDKFPQKTSPS